jgi:hypothetical protein
MTSSYLDPAYPDRPAIRSKSPLKLAGYDISQLPMTTLCNGLSLDWPLEVAHNDVPNQ